MSVARTPELKDMVREWAAQFEEDMQRGVRSLRVQFDIEGRDEPFTVFANRTGVFVVEPGAKPVPVKDWLA